MRAAASPNASAPRLITRGCAWLRPSESLWAICHKITYLNYMQIGDWRDLLFDGKRPRRLTGTSLAAWHHVPQTRLADLLGVASDDLDYATTECFGLQLDYPEGWASPWHVGHLRYCPACMAQGFHSSLHQLRCLDRCPWHALELRSQCAHGEWVSCEWSRANLARPFCCHHGEPLWPGLTADRWSPHSAAADTGYAAQLVTWLESLRSMRRWRNVVINVRCSDDRSLNRELQLEEGFRSGSDWHTQDAETIGFLAEITDGLAWLRSTGTTGRTGEIVRASCQVHPTLLTGVEAPRLPLRVPAIDSLPPEGGVFRGWFPDGKHPYCEIQSIARDRFLARLEEFRGAFAQHIARCPAEECVTDATPGGGCLLRRTTRGAFELAQSSALSWSEMLARERGEEVTVPARLRDAVDRVLVRQFEQALLWLGLAWRDLPGVPRETLQLLSWICSQAAAALARNFTETLLLDLTVTQSATEPARTVARRAYCRPAPLLEQRHYYELDQNPRSSPFALLSSTPGEVAFYAYHRISMQQWSDLALTGWLCDSVGRGPVVPAKVAEALARLSVADRRCMDD